MKKHNYIIILTAALILVFTNACNEEFLDVKPRASLNEASLANEDGLNALLIGAYSMLDGVSSQGFGWEAATSNWVYGSIRGGEANKGTDAGDQPDINPIMNYSEAATNPYLNVKWRALYEGISRANGVITVAGNALQDGTIDQATHDLFVLESRALRGFYHFEAWRMWNVIPYVDENTDQLTLTNTAAAGDMLIADLQAAADGLPQDMGLIGKWNKTVVQVVLAKALMQIKEDYDAAKTLLEDVVANGVKPNGDPIGLASNFGDIFRIANRNDIEAIYTVQYSVNDGSGGWNGGWGEVLNFPYKSGASPGGCCGFFQPTQEFVNSFRTSGGLPLLDGSYNNDPVVNDQGLLPEDPFVEDMGPLDPRLDWSVGRRGIPFLDWGEHTGQDWIRDQSYAGPYSPKKNAYRQEEEGQNTEVGSWTSGWTANGTRLIRYADVLLLLAECQAKTGELDAALANVNAVRARAANPAGFVTEDDGVTPAANYQISEYPAGYFTDEATAMKAIMMERKLELGMEGHRFFDLQRWGNAQEEINAFLQYEKTQPWGQNAYGSTTTFGSEDVFFPIPQRQLDLSGGNLSQNR